MKNLVFPALCLFRHFAIKVSFPWTQNETGELAKSWLILDVHKPVKHTDDVKLQKQKSQRPFDHQTITKP